MDCNIPGLPVPHHLPEFAQVHVHWIGDAIPTISSSVALFSFCPQSFLASGTFPMSHLFTSDDQNTGTSASASVLPVNIQDWFLLRLISLLSKGLFRSLLQHHSSCAQNSHTWLVVLLLDSTNRKHFHNSRKFYWMMLPYGNGQTNAEPPANLLRVGTVLNYIWNFWNKYSFHSQYDFMSDVGLGVVPVSQMRKLRHRVIK